MAAGAMVQSFDLDFGEVMYLSMKRFDDLPDRPKYNGQMMTHSTDIPLVPTKTSELTNDSDYQTGDEVAETAAEAAAEAAAGKQDIIPDLDTIRAGAAEGATAVQPADLHDATLTITRNGTSAGTFSANASRNTTIDIAVPTTAAEVDALPDTTKYGANLTLSMNSTDYKVTVTLKDQDGNTLGAAQTIDLPLESVVVSGRYDNTNKKIVLTLQNGTTVDIPVGDLVAGLQTEITSTNKLSADLVDDTNATHKFVTAGEKTTWNGKYAKPSGGIPKTDLASAVQTSLTKADNALPATNVVQTTGSSTTNVMSQKAVDDNYIRNTVVATFWHGTEAQYNAITTKDAKTLYLIEEE